MTTKKQLINWLINMPDDTKVWVDEGGITLNTDSGLYYEIGGEPEEDDK